MANYNVNCPHCGQLLTVQDEWAGLGIRCPNCENDFLAPKKRKRKTGKASRELEEWLGHIFSYRLLGCLMIFTVIVFFIGFLMEIFNKQSKPASQNVSQSQPSRSASQNNSQSQTSQECEVTVTCSLTLNSGAVVSPECQIYILAENPDIEKKFVQYREKYEKAEIESSKPVLHGMLVPAGITHQQNMDRMKADFDMFHARNDIGSIFSYARKNNLSSTTFRAEANLFLPPGNYTVCAFTSYGNASLRWVKHINANGKRVNCHLANDGECVLYK